MIDRLAGALRLFARPRPPVGTTPADVVWSENKWRLLRYRPIGDAVESARRRSSSCRR